MARSIYIAGAEPGSGKSVIALGLMERLIADGRRAGFFRPVVRSGGSADGLIRLMSARYALAAPYEAMYGVNGRRAAELPRQRHQRAGSEHPGGERRQVVLGQGGVDHRRWLQDRSQRRRA